MGEEAAVRYDGRVRYRLAIVLLLITSLTYASPFGGLDTNADWLRALPSAQRQHATAQVRTMLSSSATEPIHAAARDELSALLDARLAHLPAQAAESAIAFIARQRRREGVPVAEIRLLAEVAAQTAATLPDEEATLAADVLGDPLDSGAQPIDPSRTLQVAITRWELRALTVSPYGEVAEAIETIMPLLDAESRHRAERLAGGYQMLAEVASLDPASAKQPTDGGEALRELLLQPPIVAEYRYLTNPQIAELVDAYASETELRDPGARRWLSRSVAFLQRGAERELRIAVETRRRAIEASERSITRSAAQRLEQSAQEGFAALVEFAEGNSPRTGDTYRWTILPLLSNPLAGDGICAGEDSADALARGYVEDVLEAAAETILRRYPQITITGSDAPATICARVVEFGSTDAADARLEQAVQEWYAQIVVAAQGLPELPEGMRATELGGYSQAQVWANTHGFLALTADADPHISLAGLWFELANVSSVAVERISNHLRGFDMLGWTLDRARARQPYSTVTAPRLALTQELVEKTRNQAISVADAIASLLAIWDAATPTEAVGRIAASNEERERDS